MSEKNRDVDRLRQQLTEFLTAEESFVEMVRSAVSRIGRHPVGKSFSQEDIDGMIALRSSMNRRSQDRQSLQSAMAAVSGSAEDSAMTISAFLSIVPELADLKVRCDEIRKQTLQGYTSLQLVLAQLRESHGVISVVLDAALGSQTDSSRYDSKGRPVVKPGIVDGRRVA
ncbi:MAG: hypothetical protein ABJZ55_23650 [Fuerstiella sp.]